ncbi:uncharacterized protein LOC113790589 [Dermatophagoides pteronyssinus]|uniref:Uncharacterized protein LOC113790589 n=1 Tax=Dermatophagoides pteronyssinus TaxID=6956 RepID=A0A6P6XT70_DERPT|nr:uncharacterized protein LOC113790589 [Dermatophagoides pteronyssinus]
MLQETLKAYLDHYYFNYYNNQQTKQQPLMESFGMFSIAYTTAQYISYLLFGITVFIIKCYMSFYILSCCHEILEDHREGSINARSKSVHLMMSLLMLTLTFIGLYGIYTFHLGLILTWLLLKPFIRILELESPTWTTFVMIIIAMGSTICYNTYDVFDKYTSSPLF